MEKISIKIILLIGFTVTTATLVGGIIDYIYSYEQEKIQIFDNLQYQNSKKIEFVEYVYINEIQNTRIYSQMDAVYQVLHELELVTNSNSSLDDVYVPNELYEIISKNQINRILFLTPSEGLYVMTHSGINPVNFETDSFENRILVTQRDDVLVYNTELVDSQIVIWLEKNVLDNNTRLGTIIVEYDLAQIFSDLYKGSPTDNFATKVMLVEQKNSQIYRIEMEGEILEYQPIQRGKAPYALFEALDGIESYGSYTDKNGNQVLAAWGYLPSWKMGIVSKIPESSALVPFFERLEIIIPLEIAVVTGFIALSVFVSRSISHPLVTFRKKIEQFGELEESDSDTLKNDSIKSLDFAFSKMQKNIQEKYAEVEKLEKILNISSFVLKFDLDGNLVSFNEKFSQKIDTEKINSLSTYVQETPDIKLEEIMSQVNSEHIWIGELKHSTITDDPIWTFCILSPNQKNNNDGFTLIEIDITAQKLVEEKLKKLDVEKANFITIMSHELKTPLTAALIHAKMLTNLKDEKFSEDVNLLLKSLNNLSVLISDVFDIQKISLQQITLTKEKIDLNEFCTNLEKSVSPFFVNEKTTFEFSCKGQFCMMDPVRISQVILNLVKNSIDFSNHGVISLSVEENSTDVVFCVRDQGIGISPESIERIFSTFYQVDPSLRRKHGGTGVGLSLSKGLVELHGGKMWVESKKHVGTNVFFSLPK